MTFLLSAIFPSYVKGASCYTSEVNNLQLPSLDLSQIGKQNNLRLTGEITLRHRPKGICEGFSLLFISHCLNESSVTNTTFAQLKKIRSVVLSRHNIECFMLQKLQNNLIGIDGKADQKILSEWKDIIDEMLSNHNSVNIRALLLNAHDSHNLSADVYATILEIDGLYQARVNPGVHRFHNLIKDVLHELLDLLKLMSINETFFKGNIEDLQRELSKLTSGIYHVSLPKHAFVYIVDGLGCRFICDVNIGIKPFIKDQPKEFNCALRSYLTDKPKWITISSCAKTLNA